MLCDHLERWDREGGSSREKGRGDEGREGIIKKITKILMYFAPLHILGRKGLLPVSLTKEVSII